MFAISCTKHFPLGLVKLACIYLPASGLVVGVICYIQQLKISSIFYLHMHSLGMNWTASHLQLHVVCRFGVKWEEHMERHCLDKINLLRK